MVKSLEHVQYLSDFHELPRYVQLRAVQILRMHVMGNVRQRIEAGHRDFVNEIRVCTCLFLGFPSLKVTTLCCLLTTGKIIEESTVTPWYNHTMHNHNRAITTLVLGSNSFALKCIQPLPHCM